MTAILDKSLVLSCVSCFVAILLPAFPAAASETLAFDLSITLSQKAAQKLKTSGERIMVSASYYGDPKPNAKKHADDVGRIDLGTETIEIAGLPGPVHVTGTKIKFERFQWIDGPSMVNVSVYSARKTSQDNLLGCDFIDGKLADVAEKPTTLHCSLLVENAEINLKP